MARELGECGGARGDPDFLPQSTCLGEGGGGGEEKGGQGGLAREHVKPKEKVEVRAGGSSRAAGTRTPTDTHTHSRLLVLLSVRRVVSGSLPRPPSLTHLLTLTHTHAALPRGASGGAEGARAGYS